MSEGLSAAQVRAYLEHHLGKLEVIAEGRPCSISVTADNFAGKANSGKFTFYIRDVSSGIMEYDAPLAVLAAARQCMSRQGRAAKAAELRRMADDLEGGAV